MDALLNYDTSPLNPALKFIVPVIFFVVLGIYVSTRRYYSDKIRTFVDILLMFAVCAVIAGILRYFGDGIIFGFTTDYSLKWFQSLAYIAVAVFFILGGYTLLHLSEGENR